VKKLLASLLVVCMLFSAVTVISGCSKKDKDKSESTKKSE
jgi:hypothetical protein